MGNKQWENICATSETKSPEQNKLVDSFSMLLVLPWAGIYTLPTAKLWVFIFYLKTTNPKRYTNFL